MGQQNDQILSEYLLEKGMVNHHAMDRAFRAAIETREPLGDVLTKLGILSENDLVSSYKDVSKIKSATKDDFPPERVEISDIEESFLKEARVLPLQIDENVIKVAVANPFDEYPKKAIEFITGKRAEYFVAPASDISAIYEIDQQNQYNDEGWADENGELDDLDRLKDLASEAPVIRFVNRLVHQAVEREASDIHIEPMEASLKIRMRLDGMLEDIEDPPHRFKSAIISRIKIMAGLDIAERRLPQDGRIRLAVQGRDIDFRISTTPTNFGESVVMRVLNQHKMVLDLERLGFPKKEREQFHEAIKKPNGIILVTGPTGSGKTTTLYAALKLLNNPESKVLTIEDPIEYMLEGINQVQVNSNIGLTFASALRSFLRQDPDIMMVGEIRDIETANIAIQASLTGHLILSTLHTNSAAGAISRLMDMGVEDYLLSGTLNMVLAQRLVRKLCNHCKIEKGEGYEANGCPECQGTGYKGRTTIIEILEVDQEIEKLIKERASDQEIEKTAIEAGMRTMKMQADFMVKTGITSRQEVNRVIGELI